MWKYLFDNFSISLPERLRGNPWLWLGLIVLLLIISIFMTVYAKKIFKADTSSISATQGSSVVNGKYNTVATASGNSTAIIGNNNIIGITLEQHEAFLNRRELEIRKELSKTSIEDKRTIENLNRELADVQGKLFDVESSLKEHKAKLAELYQALDLLKQSQPSNSVLIKDAQEALKRGDTDKARKLLQDIFNQGTEQAAEAAYQLGFLDMMRVAYVSAYNHFNDAVRLRPDNIVYLSSAGAACIGLGYYSESEEKLNKALALSEKNYAPDDLRLSNILNNLAELYIEQGLYPKAEPLHQRALKIVEKEYGRIHPNVAGSLNNLGRLYYEWARSYHEPKLLEKAKPFLNEALEIRKKIFGDNDLVVSTTLNNLGNVYAAQKNFLKAEQFHKQALEIRKNILDPDNPRIARSMANLAEVYGAQRKFVEAEKLLKDALKIMGKKYGTNHPDVATCINNLGGLYLDQGNLVDAEQYFRQALEIRKKLYGSDHPKVAESLNNLGCVYDRQGEYAKAGLFHQQAQEMLERLKIIDR
ncbi:MAG: tetratricopeptide repeat protein [Bdellovibrionales bacterium]